MVSPILYCIFAENTNNYNAMRRLLSTILIVFFAISLMAQAWNTTTKMSPWLLNKYERQQVAVRENGGPLRSQGRPVINYILALVESTDGDTTIKQKGGFVWQDFGYGFYAAFLPVDSLGALDQSASIVRMEANELSRVLNDNSKEILGVDKAWNGIELPQAFRGNGVLAGVMDVGFDFTHPSFRNEDGSSRILDHEWHVNVKSCYDRCHRPVVAGQPQTHARGYQGSHPAHQSSA